MGISTMTATTTTRVMASPACTLRLLVAVGLVLFAQRANGQARHDCPEAAVTCLDRSDASTCTELPGLRRQTADQVILRAVEVTEGSYTGVELQMEASSHAQDGAFAAARDRLCLVPAPSPSPGVPGSSDDEPTPTAPTGPVWYGGPVGIYVYRR
jgi:hypothetical protein